jgi:uncharacterized iron-regulated membrane protein
MTSPGRRPSPAVRNRPPLRHRLHRLLGTTTGALLLYLIVTGVPLQLTGALNLDGSYVTSPTVLDWYGIRPPTAGASSAAAVHVDDVLFWGHAPLAEAATFQGAVLLDGMVVVAAGRNLLVFPPTRPDAAETIALPATIRRIGRAGNRVLLETDRGLGAMDADLLDITEDIRTDMPIDWAELEPLSGARLETYQRLSRGRVLTRERLLQDLHSGRAFGVAGEWAVNLGSAAMVVLALTGFLIWWRTR